MQKSMSLQIIHNNRETLLPISCSVLTDINPLLYNCKNRLELSCAFHHVLIRYNHRNKLFLSELI